MFKELQEYIKNWQELECNYPENEDGFINPFIEYLNSLDDCRDLSFDGDGAYFGYQISIVSERAYFGDPYLNFEIAYDKERVVVYRGDNYGYCVPEYLDIRIEREPELFNKMFETIKVTILKLMGLN